MRRRRGEQASAGSEAMAADATLCPACRPRRRFQREQPRPMALTARDAAVIHRIYLTGFCLAQSTFLFAREADPAGGGDNWSKRLRALYDAGWITRLYLPQSRYLVGSQWPIYCVETGVAAQAAALRKPWATIDRAARARLSADAAPLRAQVSRLLTSDAALSEQEVSAGLRARTQHALKLCSGQPCHVPHILLASTFAAIAWYGLARAGSPVRTIRPDGSLDLNLFADGALGSAVLPDVSFIAKRTLFCVEAETGTSSRTKIQAKVRRYLSFARGAGLARYAASGEMELARMRVIFHCGTAAHLRMIAAIIAAEAPQGTPLFLLSDAATFHLDFSQLHFKRDLPVTDWPDAPGLYDALASLTRRALFAQVEGIRNQRPELGYVALTDAV
jgi:hypothetical protein